MGVLNVTADSFSDGGQFLDPATSVKRAGDMIVEGASIIDVGAESTRPGSDAVDAATQIARACPVIERIRCNHPLASISIDTRSSLVAKAAIDAGANIVNDVSALRDDPEMAGIAATSEAAVILMHRQGRSKTMQVAPYYVDVVKEVCDFLRCRIEAATSAGIAESRLMVDPGIGFGKTTDHNLILLHHLDRLVAVGPPVVIGLSRKRFLGDITGITEPAARDAASLAGALWSVSKGARIIRTHAVADTVQALSVWLAMGEESLSGRPGIGQT
jgi:dihydropteroate synthase